MAALAALLLAVAAGCGSGSSTDATGTNASSAPPPGASKQFLGPKGYRNAAARFGEEATAEQYAAINQVVEEMLEARGRKEWAAQCATLSAAAQRRIELASKSEPKSQSCASQLGSEGERAPAGVLVNDMDGPITAVRVKGTKGFALYHGTTGKDWALPVEEEEDGEWKVAAPLGEELYR